MSEIVHINSLSYGSAGVGRLASGKAVFVDGTVPGDTLAIELVSDGKSYARGKVVEVVEASPDRVQPFCPYAGICGGCPWAQVSYETQLTAKRVNLVSNLTRIAGIDADAAENLTAECVPSKRRTGYRNKVELAVGRDGAGRIDLGFHQMASNKLIVPDQCPIAHDAIAKAPKALRGAVRFLNSRSDLGVFRVGVRHSLRTKSLEVALWTTPGPAPRAQIEKVVMDALHPTSIVRVLAEEGKARKVKKVEVLHGAGSWEEELSGFRHRVSAPSFFQVNTAQAEKLIALAMEGLELEEGDFVADLYSGVGSFTLPLAAAGCDVVAVESAGSSVRDLRRSADKYQLPIEVLGGDAARELPTLGGLDALVVDPPRAGLAKSVPADIAAAGPARVAYVSCDPATLCRDIARFAEVGYRPVRITPVDLFPQTYHCETVAILSRESR
ncbi:MAG: 23S rRNA (uracil(1939)-C(5))-methyltransferase RlmD [Coriobacteriia bacterium]|nr:23S rRNA (uracil(1939)-C(5))-methyltransferase RlmD [Coriobacteriia bacterium]